MRHQYIIQLITNIYLKNQQTYEKTNQGFYYLDYYVNHLGEIITNTKDNPKYKVNDPWPTNLGVDYKLFTNEQLIIIYQYVVLEDSKNLGMSPKPISPIIEENTVPENWEEVVEETKDERPNQVEPNQEFELYGWDKKYTKKELVKE